MTEWTFRDSYAGIVGLGGRIENFRIFDADGRDIQNRKLAPGNFEAQAPATKFRYEVNLTPPIRASDSAMVSWLNNEQGLLMLRDLLPVFQSMTSGQSQGFEHENPTRATVRLMLPDGWAAYSNESEGNSSGFETADADRGLVADGQWAFTDNDAIELATRIIKAHRDVFGSRVFADVTLILIPFPQTVAADKWSAETRGSTVTLLMGRLPSKVGALAQLSTPLTHELFHLWIPNGLALQGDYDWFYEGFTIYQAARTAVRLDLLTFTEFLNAIGRAYDSYQADADHDRWSLIEASKRRWTIGQSSVYSKSMVIAFLYDLRLRKESHGKRSLDDVYRRLFQQSRLSSTEAIPDRDGNEAVTSALSLDPNAQDFVRLFVRNSAAIDLRTELAPFGLTVESFGLRTRIAVSDQLSKQQRDLLRELGYNNYVRSPHRSAE